MVTPSAVVAAHRFGLGEADLAVVGADPARWLISQVGPADAQPGTQLPTLADGVRTYARFLVAQARLRAAEGDASKAQPAGGMSTPRMNPNADAMAGTAPAPMAAAALTPQDATERAFVDAFRDLTQNDIRAHLGAGIETRRPFAERLALFWTNHFTVSATKATVRGLTGAFERDAIRPHIGGSFLDLLRAAVTHGAMLRYLDNDRSAGAQSRVALNRGDRAGGPMGLNENLAREVLELHTLGAASKAYAQADVTAFAAVLTGWRLLVRPQDAATLASGAAIAGFDPNWHEPGDKLVLGQRIPQGQQGLEAVLRHLVQHPATARFIATKLARHFVADDPPLALVDRLAERFLSSQGHLPALYAELIAAPESWALAPAKLKTPQEFVVSSFRLLGIGSTGLARQADGGIVGMGQRLHAAPSPAGWPDREEEWLGPEAVWKRVEWATRLADRAGRQIDARQLARQSLGPRLSDTTFQQIERAADAPQALALLLLSPEFQRR